MCRLGELGVGLTVPMREKAQSDTAIREGDVKFTPAASILNALLYVSRLGADVNFKQAICCSCAGRYVAFFT